MWAVRGGGGIVVAAVSLAFHGVAVSVADHPGINLRCGQTQTLGCHFHCEKNGWSVGQSLGEL